MCGSAPHLVPLQFVDNDSSKGQRACTSSHHAFTVHRKHFLLLFFFLGCFTDIYVFFFKKTKQKQKRSSCLSLVNIFFTNVIKLQVELLFFSFSVSSSVVLHGHMLRMILCLSFCSLHLLVSILLFLLPSSFPSAFWLCFCGG